MEVESGAHHTVEVVVTYAYNSHAIRTHSADRTVSCSFSTHHIYNTYVHHSTFINSLGVFNKIILVPLDILYPPDKSQEQSSN